MSSGTSSVVNFKNGATSSTNSHGLKNTNGTVTITGGAITNETASYSAFCNYESGTATITGGTISNSGGGNAITTYSGTLKVNGTGVLIKSAGSGNGISLSSGTLYFSAGFAESVSGYGLYVHDSGKAHINSDSNSGNGIVSNNGAYIASTNNYAIYASTSATVNFGNISYYNSSYAPTALTGGASKYAYYCTSGVSSCNYGGGRLFYVTDSYNIRNVNPLAAFVEQQNTSATWNRPSGTGITLTYERRTSLGQGILN